MYKVKNLEYILTRFDFEKIKVYYLIKIAFNKTCVDENSGSILNFFPTSLIKAPGGKCYSQAALIRGSYSKRVCQGSKRYSQKKRVSGSNYI